MNHPWDKSNKKQKKNLSEYDAYFLMMGFKDTNRVIDKKKERDRYGAKERRRIKEEMEYKEINNGLL